MFRRITTNFSPSQGRGLKLVVATKQSLYADGLYSTILGIVDERTGKLIEDHPGKEMTPFVRALCDD